jgi:hypothetical protein
MVLGGALAPLARSIKVQIDLATELRRCAADRTSQFSYAQIIRDDEQVHVALGACFPPRHGSEYYRNADARRDAAQMLAHHRRRPCGLLNDRLELSEDGG